MIRALVFLTLIAGVFAAQTGAAQSICGRFNLLEKDGKFVADFLNKYSLSTSLAPRRACGLPGETFAICQECSDPVTKEMADVIQPLYARRDHRAWHLGWHRFGIEMAILRLKSLGLDPLAPPATDWHKRCPILRPRRTTGEDLSGTPRTDAEIVAEWQNAGWMPKDDADGFIRSHNVFDGELAGEDFLYMHRQMIKMTQIELSYFGKACVAPWSDVPASVDDSAWPVPMKTSRDQDTAALETIRAMVAQLRDPAVLRGMSLNDLGHCINNTIHGGFHNVYSAPARCKSAEDESVECDDLLPSWSAPVNKHFWKLHGLVDDMIGRWLQAHGKSTINENCAGRADCHEWKGKFTGPMPK
jgi:hypothetical protein